MDLFLRWTCFRYRLLFVTGFFSRLPLQSRQGSFFSNRLLQRSRITANFLKTKLALLLSINYNPVSVSVSLTFLFRGRVLYGKEAHTFSKRSQGGVFFSRLIPLGLVLKFYGLVFLQEIIYCLWFVSVSRPMMRVIRLRVCSPSGSVKLHQNSGEVGPGGTFYTFWTKVKKNIYYIDMYIFSGVQGTAIVLLNFQLTETHYFIHFVSFNCVIVLVNY